MVFALLFIGEMGYFVSVHQGKDSMNHSEFCRTCAALRIFALLCWLAGVLWLSLAPSLPHPPDLLSWDKLQHAGAYALMTFLAGRVFILFCRAPRRGWLAAAAFAIAVGGLTEVAQGTLSDVRYAEWGDMLANACGAAIALSGAFVWLRMIERRKL
jgi:VanZ family protein